MFIASGSNGKKNCNVVLTSNSSCSCPDYKKWIKKVYCKHKICLVLNVLANERFLTLLNERYFLEDDLKFLFRNKYIPEPHRQPQESLKRPRTFQEILQSHQDYDGLQKWSLHRKKVKNVRCASTLFKEDIQKGVICFLVEGALILSFNCDKAVIQILFF